VKPPAGTALSTLNPCLLNACCDVWGQCGTTAEFCTNTSTGAPGTAQAGTNGCISNCGTNIVQSGPPATYMNVAYFEGFNLGRPCLNMDIHQLSAAAYTHVHFAFATLTSNYEVVIGDSMATFEFQEFVALSGPKRVLSFGGWDFSTDPSTYTIFRKGVTAANRLTMATNIANFIIANNLDGVDIDWEYPGVS
jgi:GH18 family chitinase